MVLVLQVLVLREVQGEVQGGNKTQLLEVELAVKAILEGADTIKIHFQRVAEVERVRLGQTV
jgi:hypothetical protein